MIFLRSGGSTFSWKKNHMNSGSTGRGEADEPRLESLAVKSIIEIVLFLEHSVPTLSLPYLRIAVSLRRRSEGCTAWIRTGCSGRCDVVGARASVTAWRGRELAKNKNNEKKKTP